MQTIEAPMSLAERRQRQHGESASQAPPLAERLLTKREVLDIVGLSFPTVWAWMRAGKFPRSRVVGGKSMWLASEVSAWLAGLPLRSLKGDEVAPVERRDASAENPQHHR
jgi:predicted DNA-binding transcriptional regulator AlpA